MLVLKFIYSDKSKNIRKNIPIILPLGQVISKCPFGVFVLTKNPTLLFNDFCPSLYVNRD